MHTARRPKPPVFLAWKPLQVVCPALGTAVGGVPPQLTFRKHLRIFLSNHPTLSDMSSYFSKSYGMTMRWGHLLCASPMNMPARTPKARAS